jgi:hypothetical protein
MPCTPWERWAPEQLEHDGSANVTIEIRDETGTIVCPSASGRARAAEAVNLWHPAAFDLCRNGERAR